MGIDGLEGPVPGKRPEEIRPSVFAVLGVSIFAGALAGLIATVANRESTDPYQVGKCFEHVSSTSQIYSRIEFRFKSWDEINYTYVDLRTGETGTKSRSVDDFKSTYPYESRCGRFQDLQLDIKLNQLRKELKK